MPKRKSRSYGRARALTLGVAVGSLQTPEFICDEDAISEIEEEDRRSEVSVESRSGGLADPHQSLEAVLCSLSALERTEMVCQWATSLEVAQRFAIANVLVSSVNVFGAISVIEHLALDPDPEVRGEAGKAARRRRQAMPERCEAVLRGLANDPRPEVREVALVALETRRS